MENPQRILAGRYEVGELIGRGGMAEVHIGHDTRLGRTVAIKVLRADLARDPSFLARFRREAQAAAALNHPAIVAVYDTGEDIGTDAAGNRTHTPFIVMEYVEGHTVRDILRDGHAVPIDEAVEITSGVLSALEYSHHAGIVHRDIKPANVMITPTGAVKVMDFGIARAVADSAATMTQTQAVIGTAQYLSPEQARGETVDARSDLYSTGCLFFELLTGRPPFTGDSPVAVAYQHVSEAAPAPSSVAPDVPEVLDRITLRALTKDRDQRYSTAAEFRSDLDAAMHGGTLSAPPAATAVLGAAALGAGAAALGADAGATQLLSPTPTQAWGQAAATTPVAEPPVAPEDEEPAKKSHKGLIWTLVAVGVVALALIVTLLLLDGGKDEAPQQVAVPNVVGMTKDAATQELDKVNLKISALQAPSSERPEGDAASSDPKAGTQVDEGSTVKVYFSAGPQSVEIPDDLAGKSFSEAQAELTALKLKVSGPSSENSADVKKDTVTRTEPKAGSTVDAGATVEIFTSNGLVELPDVTGEKADDAVNKLTNELKLQVSQTSQDVTDKNQDGKVLAQSPNPGSVAQHSTVTLTVGKFAEQMLTVPGDLIGKSQEDASAELQQNGFTHGEDQNVQSDQPEGTVVNVQPGPGTQVKASDPIVLFISLGPGTPDPTSTDGLGGGGRGDDGGGRG
ncbi:Stk1 family PASTA domain-containing Ser/Thr kinase [Luteimicrobium subarcticum]|uniref:Stk1 family PASTA domain-containing Ser/Thr kinase n=1 Tax=Luteimicrobium subarcticum TaxID=620910 RepID=UPI001FE4CEC2|nr:Stk1 family PASTA domain-containing Ser/Thr kinase [Luteimicrobium subarcticum]